MAGNKKLTMSSLSPAMREYLSTWPAGEERQLADYYSLKRMANNTLSKKGAVSEAQHQTAEKLGLLTKRSVTVPQGNATYSWNRTDWYFTRTEKPVTVYVPRGPDPNYASRFPFPWSSEVHWEKVQKSSVRAVRHITSKLASIDDNDWRARRAHEVKMQLQYPKFITTVAELNGARTALLACFREEPDAMRYLPRPLHYLATFGAGLYMLLLELLIEPTFDEDGKFVRFVEIEQDRACEEVNHMVGDTFSIAERYKAYRRQQNGITA